MHETELSVERKSTQLPFAESSLIIAHVDTSYLERYLSLNLKSTRQLIESFIYVASIISVLGKLLSIFNFFLLSLGNETCSSFVLLQANVLLQVLYEREHHKVERKETLAVLSILQLATVREKAENETETATRTGKAEREMEGSSEERLKRKRQKALILEKQSPVTEQNHNLLFSSSEDSIPCAAACDE